MERHVRRFLKHTSARLRPYAENMPRVRAIRAGVRIPLVHLLPQAERLTSCGALRIMAESLPQKLSQLHFSISALPELRPEHGFNFSDRFNHICQFVGFERQNMVGPKVCPPLIEI